MWSLVADHCVPPLPLQIYIAGLATVRDISLHEEYVQLGDNASTEDELDVRTNILPLAAWHVV